MPPVRPRPFFKGRRKRLGFLHAHPRCVSASFKPSVMLVEQVDEKIGGGFAARSRKLIELLPLLRSQTKRHTLSLQLGSDVHRVSHDESDLGTLSRCSC